MLFGGLLTRVAPLYGQDSTVCITPQAARYFLEADDERWVLREKDSVQTELILTLSEQSLTKDKIIQTYANDSSSFKIREKTLALDNTFKQQRINKLEGNLRKRKKLEVLVLVVGTVIAIIL